MHHQDERSRPAHGDPQASAACPSYVAEIRIRKHFGGSFSGPRVPRRPADVQASYKSDSSREVRRRCDELSEFGSSGLSRVDRVIN